MQSLTIVNKAKAIKRSEEEKIALIIKWETSQQTINAFCKEQGIAHSLFYYWLKKYRNKPSSATAVNDFIDLKVLPEQHHFNQEHLPFAELVLAGGCRITLFKEVAASYIQSILSTGGYAGIK
jgi:hypothetical protein